MQWPKRLVRLLAAAAAAFTISTVLDGSGSGPVASLVSPPVVAAQTAGTDEVVHLSLAHFCVTDLIHLPRRHTWMCEVRYTSEESTRTITIPAGINVLFDTINMTFINADPAPGFACETDPGAVRCSTLSDATIPPRASITVVTENLLSGDQLLSGFSLQLQPALPSPPYIVGRTTADGGDVGWD